MATENKTNMRITFCIFAAYQLIKLKEFNGCKQSWFSKSSFFFYNYQRSRCLEIHRARQSKCRARHFFFFHTDGVRFATWAKYRISHLTHCYLFSFFFAFTEERRSGIYLFYRPPCNTSFSSNWILKRSPKSSRTTLCTKLLRQCARQIFPDYWSSTSARRTPHRGRATRTPHRATRTQLCHAIQTPRRCMFSLTTLTTRCCRCACSSASLRHRYAWSWIGVCHLCEREKKGRNDENWVFIIAECLLQRILCSVPQARWRRTHRVKVFFLFCVCFICVNAFCFLFCSYRRKRKKEKFWWL